MTGDALSENYELAGYHAKQSWGNKPALILIDFSEAYFRRESPLFGGAGCESALSNAVKLCKFARNHSFPIIFTSVVYSSGGVNGGAFYAKVPALSCFDRGAPTSKLSSLLEVKNEDLVIEKQYPSAFFGTSLAASLTWLKVDTLLIAGLTTSGCVRATCVDSISNGFVTLIVSDAVGDRAKEPHEANLFDMSAKYADLITTEEVDAYFSKLRERN